MTHAALTRLATVAAARPSEALALDPGDVHLWCVDVDANADHPADSLAPDERSRAARFLAARDRRRFVATRATLRSLLGRYLDVDPREVRIGYGPGGKPELAGRSSCTTLSFNLAHSDRLALFAFARDRRVGIDVEVVRPVAELDLVAQRLFTTRERMQLEALFGRERRVAFFHAWTRKEALAKGVGAGLALDFAHLEVPLAANVAPTPVHLVATGSVGHWWLHPIDVDPGYVAAVAVEGEGHRIRWWGRACRLGARLSGPLAFRLRSHPD